MINRRTFVLGTTLAAMVPTPGISLPQRPPATTRPSEPVFMIDGWADPNDGGHADQLWLKAGPGFRTAWR